ncbi:MAG: Stp1/IreP family PP2C-type Ser/Thr phosphatase [Bryobacteraceae bacterium]|nr:Stp1/IreP family PP2C-type Ser/Thr phosphatase [Bryobacteraceae bacterium]
MPVYAAGRTDVGLVRPNNEDRFLIAGDLGLALVADGMGGAACGEVAAQMTVDCVEECVRGNGIGASVSSLESAITEANRRVWLHAKQSPQCTGMGTTVVAACWRGDRLAIANVGDSRAYLLRHDQLTQLSYDQSLVNELRHNLGLSEEQIKRYANRNVLTQAIGTSESVQIRTNEIDFGPGDVVILCSDGLHGIVSDEEIHAILSLPLVLELQVGRLIDAAKRAGGNDNITIAVIRND